MTASAHEEIRIHEEGVSRGLVLRVLIGALVISFVLCVVTYLLLRAREAQLRPGGQFAERHLGPPHQSANILAIPYEVAASLDPLAERQRARLQSYGWIDRDRRTAHIPIDRAMEIIVRRGEGR